MIETFTYEGFDIPVPLMWQTGGGPDNFADICKTHMAILQCLAPVSSGDSVVEIGCGIGRDAIPLTKLLTTGRYLGIDIQQPSIDWCSANITRQHPNFTFAHFDVREEWFNKYGTLHLRECSIPAPDDSVDLVLLHSVFTHMLPDNIAHYLREFRRCLRPSGKVLATFFVVDDAILARQNPKQFITFPHQVEAGCFIHDPQYPTQIVGYDFPRIERLARDADLTVLPVVRGHWSGTVPDPVGGQDNVVFTRSG